MDTTSHGKVVNGTADTTTTTAIGKAVEKDTTTTIGTAKDIGKGKEKSIFQPRTTFMWLPLQMEKATAAEVPVSNSSLFSGTENALIMDKKLESVHSS